MIPHIPDHAPFSAEQRSWLNGLFAGLFSVEDLDAGRNGSTASTDSGDPVTILYGSQTGTAEGLARRAARRLRESGCAPAVHPLEDVAPADLSGMERLLVIVSTYGDGEMPDHAEPFWEDLRWNAPSLEGVAFSVLALGDSSYPDFCQAGKDIDARLEELGARRFYKRVDCDVDVDDPFEAWLGGVTGALPETTFLAQAA